MSDIVNYIKKIGFGRTLLTIGCINWIIVATTFFLLLLIQPKVPGVIWNFFVVYYLRVSIIPAIIGLALTIKVNKGYRPFNFIINTIFILLYILAYWFMSNIGRFA